MKKHLLALGLVLFACVATWAQRTVTGKVVDKQGEVLIGASILAKGTTSGTVTDIDGTYSLSVPANASILVISYTGYNTQEITLGSSNVLDITLEAGITLEETVITGLGIKRSEKSVPYAVQTLKSEDLNVIRQTNINNAIAGKIAGVQLRGQSTVKLDQNPVIRIRGAGSLTDKSPLYVIDGTPSNSLDFNMDDIESLTVLKGPNATAIYGQRGDAGVVVVTTKKGVKRPGIGIQVNQSTFLDRVYILPKYQNAYAGGGSADLIKFSWEQGMPEEWKTFEGKYYHDYSDDASWGPRMVGQEYIPWYSWYVGTPDFGKTAKLTPQPDNIRDFYNTGVTTNTNVNFTKATDGFSTRVSLTKQGTKGMLPNSGMDKYTLSTQNNLSMGKHFEVGANINFTTAKVNGEFVDGYSNNSTGSFNSWFHRNLDMDKIRELKDMRSPQGILGSWNHNNPGSYLSSPLAFYGANYWYNFFSYFDQLDQSYNRERLFGDINLTYKLNDKFRVTGFVRRNQVNTVAENRGPAILQNSATQTGFKAFYATGQTFFREDNYEVLAVYSDRIGDLLSVELNAGGNIRKETDRRFTGNTVDGLSVPDLFTLGNSIKQPFAFGNFRSNKEVRSLYARGSFGLKDMIFVDWSVRNDWSSALPVENNSYLYPSVGGSFVFSELTKDALPFLSFGKIRGSWAQVGSDLDPYQLALTYGLGADQFNGNILMGTPNELVDPNIQPSLSSAIEFGVDLRFAKNRLGLSVTYYDESKTNEILSVSVAGASGFTSKKINAGQIDRSGVEIQLEAKPFATKNFSWDMNLNFARNTTQIVELADGINAFIAETGTFGTTSGARLVHVVGEKWGQIRGGGIQKLNGQPVVDATGQFVAVPDSYFGSVLPDFTGGFLNTLNYKNFQLNVNIDFSKGGKYFSLSDHWGTFSGLFERTAELNDKGIPSREPVADGGGVHVVGVNADGTPYDGYVEAQTYWHQFRSHNIAETNVYDLTFVKVREISLGYNLPVKKMGLSKYVQTASVSLVARNPWLVYSKNRDFDPSEISDRYGENGQFPGTRSFGFNISLGF